MHRRWGSAEVFEGTDERDGIGDAVIAGEDAMVTGEEVEGMGGGGVEEKVIVGGVDSVKEGEGNMGL